MNIEQVKTEALRRMREKAPSSRTFLLKDLFTGEEWTSLSKGNRSTLGKLVAEAISDGEVENVCFKPVSKPGQSTRYIKNYKN